MAQVTYEIVEHDGGWAYHVDGVLSGTFPSHDAFQRSRRARCRRTAAPGNTTGVSYEDSDGRWHIELSADRDRLVADVKG